MFRRKPQPEPFHQSPESWSEFAAEESYRLPAGPFVRPEPWRGTHPDALLIPVEFAWMFVNENQINDCLKLEEPYIAELRASIDENGLQVPVAMYFDEMGKIRYHDGHHRMAAIRGIEDFTHIPVLLESSDAFIRGHGAEIRMLIPELFAHLSIN